MAIESLKHCPHCGDNHKGKPFAVYEDGYHCFSCGATKRTQRDFLHKQVTTVAKDITLPACHTEPSKFSVNTLAWLYQYHLSDNLIKEYGIREAFDNSIIMPVVINNEIVRYTRRWNGQQRKIYSEGGNEHEFLIEKHDNDNIVLVEDFISAIRVGEISNTYCLFGTGIKNKMLEYLINRYNTIILWLDNDKDRDNNPGQTAANNIIKRAKYHINKIQNKRAFLDIYKCVYNIVTDNDPKYYTKNEIKETLGQVNENLFNKFE